MRICAQAERLARRLDGFAGEARALGSPIAAAILGFYGFALTQRPTAPQLRIVADTLTEHVRVMRGEVPPAVWAIWRDAAELAAHPQRMNRPSGFAVLSPAERRRRASLGTAAQPRTGTAEARERADRGARTRRERGTVYRFSDVDRDRARGRRWPGRTGA